MIPSKIPAPIAAALLALITAATGSAMNCLIRLVSAELHPFEIGFFRNVFGCLAILPFALRQGLPALRPQRPGRIVYAAVVNVFSMLSFFSAVALLPLNDLTALSFTTPLFQTIGAAILLGEVVRRSRWMASAVGFLGVLIIARPGTDAFSTGSLLVLFGASAYAAVSLIIKSIAARENAYAVVLYVSGLMSCLSLGPALFMWTTPSPSALWMMALIGALGTTGWLAFAQAFKLADASALAPYDFMRLPFIAAPAYLVFGEVPDLWTWIGAAVIFTSSLAMTHLETRGARKPRSL
ncbi:MAG: DMT family transporter [Proteobacteria bacterium]|nr:DMT family transporter [Pseudomonadota bacterium]